MLSLVEKEEKNQESQIPQPPEFMGYEAKCEWLRSIEDVVEKGLFIGPNIGLFENYCIAHGLSRECEEHIATDGKIIGGKPHPLLKTMFDSMSLAKNLLAELKPKKEIKKDEEEKDSWGKDKGLLA